jgi:coenzyme F420-reducing hydrogenase delta subunit
MRSPEPGTDLKVQMSIKCKEAGFKPEVVVLYCQHCIGNGAEIMVKLQETNDFSIRPMMMPCSSKIEVPYILRILEQGADAVEVIACPDRGCRFLVGSFRAEKRIDYIRVLLDQINFGAERVGISRSSGLSAKELVALAARRAEAVKNLRPNPMKKGEYV